MLKYEHTDVIQVIKYNEHKPQSALHTARWTQAISITKNS
jgi:hypothetical protein